MFVVIDNDPTSDRKLPMFAHHRREFCEMYIEQNKCNYKYLSVFEVQDSLDKQTDQKWCNGYPVNTTSCFEECDKLHDFDSCNNCQKCDPEKLIKYCELKYGIDYIPTERFQKLLDAKNLTYNQKEHRLESTL